MDSGGLKKELGLFDVYALATGATLSGGLFLLPGLAASAAMADGVSWVGLGGFLVLAYMVAAVPLIPATLCQVELATAMPRAGGVYYFLDRSMGPQIGTIGGVGTWLALMLKVAFALVGIGYYTALFFPAFPVRSVAVGLAVALTAVNLMGAKKTGDVQRILVTGLLSILVVFVGAGVVDSSFDGGRLVMGEGITFSALISSAGLVYVSYVGISKVSSVAEEVKDPEKTLPLGVLLSLVTVIVVYGLGIATMMALVPADQVIGNTTLPATAAGTALGQSGRIAISVAALLAFISVANAGLMSASRYPFAMSRDHIIPSIFGRISGGGIPVVAILLTGAVIIFMIVALDPTKIAKLASSFMLLLFGLTCLAVIVMRESGIASYDPGFRTPGYPWVPLLGALLPIVFIRAMGLLAQGFSLGLVLLGVAWYRFYVRHRVVRDGAVYHMFERWGRRRFDGLDREFRGILKEKGLRHEDPFDDIVARAQVIDLPEAADPMVLVREASRLLSGRIGISVEDLVADLGDRQIHGDTPVTHGVALPHVRVDDLAHPEMVLVRSKPGIEIARSDLAGTVAPVHAFFFLASPSGDVGQHLRILAQIAGRVDDEGFMEEWLGARDEMDLKEVLLRDERLLSLKIASEGPTSQLAGTRLRDLELPEGTLVALIRRSSNIIVPGGSTVLENGDRLTVIGSVEGISALKRAKAPTVKMF